ncbi:MAG: insulinase family protein [Halothiobacillaceae bacterium]|nr:insulinase family protein [Halothiobacillaceae bacterium]
MNAIPEQCPEHHSAFVFKRRQWIEALKLHVDEYEHPATGARHFHLAAQDDNNVFLVGLRTVPQDSTGVAHILEHTVLCGSERFPVRDPFFMMTRRSLNTFMNAFTSSDWTAYPFASQNKKDFFNLLDVYLDAVFFARLDALDFAQEGHRVEFAEAENPDSDLVFKGVVFNEMKGAMSNPVSVLWQSLTKHAYPSVTYHHNSGGEPEAIPDLTHEQLVAFYQRHYHPSNAVFMTYGDMSLPDVQEMMHSRALSRFARIDPHTQVPAEQRFSTPQAVSEAYVAEADSEGNTADKTHVVVGWLLGENTDLEGLLEAQLLAGVLLSNSASPLMLALETTKLGNAPSPLCGLEDSQREMLFAAGVEGSNPEQAGAVEQMMLDVLNDVADNGVPLEMVEAVLHQLELSQREITGSSYPYGLQLILHALPAAIHEGDPVALLDLEPVLARLRERVQNPDYIKGLVRRLLLDNPHRVRLALVPDTELAARKVALETQRLAEMKARMSDADKQSVVALAQALQLRQAQQDDPDILPEVTRADIPATLHTPTAHHVDAAPRRSTWFDASTNGLVYSQVVMPLPALSEDELELLPFVVGMMSELGAGEYDYLEMQQRQSAVTGGIHAYASVRATVENEQQTHAHWVLSGKALARNGAALQDLMRETLESARFDELPRLRELVAQTRAAREQGVTSSGHSHAMGVAASRLSPSAALSHRWGGLLGLQRLKKLDDVLDDEVELAGFAACLSVLHEKLAMSAREWLFVAEARNFDALAAAQRATWGESSAASSWDMALPATREPTREAWLTNTQVHFCAKAYSAVALDHADAGALALLGAYLRNGYLHRAIREQGGAYGGGASYDAESASFRFYSYRDPRLSETLHDFDRALDWLHSGGHTEQALEEALLSVISSIDKPSSPAGEAKKAFYSALHGVTPERRMAYRARLLDVTLSDLRRVASAYLVPDKASIGIVTHAGARAELETLGVSIEQV